ncbi:hypothetical protein QF037_003207 [Streptomyces canus]|nr:hypothetical protein [Streptomyces canus]
MGGAHFQLGAQDAIGLRSSCEASATNRRRRSTEVSSAAGVALVVRASRATSSWVSGSGTRRARSSEAVIAAISRRMPSTGRRARRVTSQVAAATTPSSRGKSISMTVSAVSTALCSVSRDSPAYTVGSAPSSVSTGSAAKR